MNAEITLRDLIHTLPWLSQRGFDGGMYRMLMVESGPTDETEGDLDDPVVVTWDSEDAAALLYNVQQDPRAFLSCNGSASIAALASVMLEAV